MAAVRGAGCDAAVVMGAHRSPDLVRALSAAVPTVLFVEEATPEGPDDWGLAPGMAGRVEAWALRRAMRRLRAVVVIADHEAAWARATYGRPVVVVPHSVDGGGREDATEAAVPDPSGTPEVFVVGNFAAARNAEGLGDVLDHMARRPGVGFRLAVASGTPLHPSLAGRDDGGGMRFLGAVEDPAPYYASGRRDAGSGIRRAGREDDDPPGVGGGLPGRGGSAVGGVRRRGSTGTTCSAGGRRRSS